ncbi:hypothetical protein [Leifsonia aquatica]|uniref:hypothetical protein n=1 Tax=Leifsonia aquatica TaxID=144185 RepID=UPI000468DA4F|nr:hypothetical protein [Leifsonia aquatica]
MNAEKPFDETRSAAIKRMLMNTVAGAPEPDPSRRRRAGLIAGLVAAALILAGGSAAVAFNAGGIFRPAEVTPSSPSPVPTTTPTSPPTPTPTAPAQPAVPGSTIPLGCPDLAEAASGSLTNPSLSSDSFYRVVDAAQEQAGVLHCQWNANGASGFITFDAVADAQAGRADIEGLRAEGATSLGAGETSAWSCEQRDLGCSVSVVDGAYWFTLNLQGRGLTREAAGAALTTAADGILAQLRAHPDPVPAWTPPSNVWNGADCSALSAAPIATILGTPGITGPTPTKYGAVNAIDAYSGDIGCKWYVGSDAQTAPDQPRSIAVDLAPGSAWAWGRRDVTFASLESVAVSGADQAELVCFTSEGTPMCWLDVLADDSWMRVDSEAATLPGDRERYIAVAEAVLAQR